MLSVAPGRFCQGLLAHAGHASYVPITGLRVLRGLAGQLGFLRMAAFLFLCTCLELGALFLGECPPGTLPAMPWEEGLTRSIP